jgi:hypothetical protein
MIRWANKHQIPLRPHGGPSLKQSRIALAQAATAPRLLRPVLSRNGGWDRLRCFAAAADYPTLAIAARVLELHPPFVSLQISQLEQTIGGQLLVRAQRGHPMHVTPLGGRSSPQLESGTLKKCHRSETDPDDIAARQPRKPQVTQDQLVTRGETLHAYAATLA